jgi:hypothetical protein
VLTARKLAQSKLFDVEMSLPGILRSAANRPPHVLHRRRSLTLETLTLSDKAKRSSEL